MAPRQGTERVGLSFFEFFAGGGMARAGLEPDWRCAFANDVDAKKASTYRANWPGEALLLADVRDVGLEHLPPITPDLVWASFPCQDLSLAGVGAGLSGARSGVFWPFWSIVEALVAAGRPPAVISLENVTGALASHGGRDFAAIALAFAKAGYRMGALVVDAALFLPQSRPRLFFVGVRADRPAAGLAADAPSDLWHPPPLRRAVQGLAPEARDAWVWWTLPLPAQRNTSLADLIEAEPAGVAWRSDAETARLLELMAPPHRRKLEAALASGGRRVGTVYRRTRPGPDGRPIQRAEARFDGLSGCLRTPAGGSSRQFLLIVEDGQVRSRLVSARETARLMGLPDSYRLPKGYSDAYHLSGDGVVVPAVRHVSQHLLLPSADAVRARMAA